MYESFYGLQERPFDLSPNPRFLFFTAQHREALAHLEYGLAGRPGLTVILGEAGTGKTTVVRKALENSSRETAIVHLSNPTLTRAEFYEFLSAGFGFSHDAGLSKVRFLHELGLSLADSASRPLALVVDEAQSVPYELLEEIRLLTNAESPTGRSLAVALVGQPELSRRLDEVRLRQLKQRVALRCELTPLGLRDTAAYIAARVQTAGGIATRLFTRDAVMAIHRYSNGIPRVISVICDNALVNGFAADLKPVGAQTITEVCRTLSLAPETATPAPAPVVPAPVAAGAGNSATAREPMFADVSRRRFGLF
jgi:general secretion pathway protein A